MLLKLAAAIVLAVLPMTFQLIPWQLSVFLLTAAAVIVAHVLYCNRDAVRQSWQNWLPQVVGILVLLTLVLWVSQLPGRLQWPGIAILVVAGILAAGLLLSIFHGLPGTQSPSAPSAKDVGSTRSAKNSPVIRQSSWDSFDRKIKEVQDFCDTRLSENAKRISLYEAKVVAREYGWTTDDPESCAVIDLTDGVRQAAIDAAIEGKNFLWGRYKCTSASKRILNKHLLVPVPADHLKTFFINPPIQDRLDPIQSATYSLGQSMPTTDNYVDLHVDRKLYIEWLESDDSKRFMGKSEKKGGEIQKTASGD